MTRETTLLDVFVASPGDTEDERTRLESVVDELNVRLGRTGDLYLDLVKWETHARPGAGRPQDVVFDTTTRTPDILIGIFRQRFGTPTGIAGSGTEEEIENAIAFWKQQGRSHRIEVMLYFKQGPYDLLTPADVEQLALVMAFRQRVSQGALVWDYKDADDFERAVRGHLATLLQDWDASPDAKETPRRPSTRRNWAIQLERTLSALAAAEDAETLTHDAVRYIRTAANTYDDELDYDELVSYCDQLLHHVESSRRVDVLVMRGDIERLAGRWQAAYDSFVEASNVARADGTPSDEAMVMRHLARLTWEHGLLSSDLSDRCERLLRELPDALVEQRAVVAVILADRLAYLPGAQIRRHHLAAEAIARIEDIAGPAVQADILLAARQALYDEEPTSVLYEYAIRVERIGRDLGDVHLISEGLGAQIVDLLRQRNITALRTTLKRHRQLSSRTPGTPQRFRQRTIEALVALAEGQFDRAEERTRQAEEMLSGVLSEEDNAAGNDVVVAQKGWRLYERGDEELRPFILELLRHLGEGVPGTENVWRLAVALAFVDMGETESGISVFREVMSSTDRFRRVEQGLFRIAILALGAEVVWALVLARSADADLNSTAQTIAETLRAHDDAGVLIGFPAIFLGDKRRFLGLAHICAGNIDEGRQCLENAARFSGHAGLLALETRCLCDLAEVAALSVDRRPDAESDLRKAGERARELGMLRLARRTLR